MKLYIASVKQSRKGNIEIIKEKFNSKAEFKKALHDNGYIVQFISTEENLESDCEKYYAKLERQRQKRKEAAEEKRKQENKQHDYKVINNREEIAIFDNKQDAIEYAQNLADMNRLIYYVHDGKKVIECKPLEKVLYYTFNLQNGKFKTEAEALDYAKQNKSISTKWLYKVVEPLANSLLDKEYILIKTLE